MITLQAIQIVIETIFQNELNKIMEIENIPNKVVYRKLQSTQKSNQTNIISSYSQAVTYNNSEPLKNNQQQKCNDSDKNTVSTAQVTQYTFSICEIHSVFFIVVFLRVELFANISGGVFDISRDNFPDPKALLLSYLL